VTHFVPGWVPKSDQKVKESEGGVQENLCEWHGSIKFSDERRSYRFDANVANFLKFHDSSMDFSEKFLKIFSLEISIEILIEILCVFRIDFFIEFAMESAIEFSLKLPLETL
jgi:hypothetical protein